MSSTDTRIVLGLDTSGFVPAAKSAEKALDGIGNAGQTSARQIAAATRGLPAQFTDIAVQLQGGANPFTILLQQGGQIKDQFGGVGNAIKGIGAVITPFSIAVTGAVAGVGALIAAMVQGSHDAEALRNTIQLTGNAAGLTASRFEQLTTRVAAASQQTVGGARDIVMGLAASGQSSAQVLEGQSKAIARIADLSGKAGKEIAASFSAQLDAPTKFAAAANQAYNFLTLAQFERIQALEKEGRSTEAVVLTNDLLLKSLDKQAQKLNVVGQAWVDAGKWASEAWKSFTGLVSEPDTLSKLEAVRRQINAITSSAGGKDPAAGTFSAGRIQALRQQIQLLAEQAKQESTLASKTSEQAAKTREGINELMNAPAKRTEPPVYFDVLDAIDGRLKLLKAAEEGLSAIRDPQEAYKQVALRMDRTAADEQDKADEARNVKHAEFVQGLVDANQRGSAELISDERERGLAVIELDRQIGERRIRDAELTGAALREALTLNDEAAALSQIKLDRQITDSLKAAADASSQSLTESISGGIVEGFRRGGSLAELFARELKAQFAKLVLQPLIRPAVEAGNASITGLFQSIAGMLAGSDLGLNPGAADFATGDLIRGRRAGGGSVQPYSDYLVGERGPEVLRMGAQGGSVIPNHALGGPSFNVSNHIHIEARTDAGQVAQVVNAGVQQGMLATMEQLRVMGVVRA